MKRFRSALYQPSVFSVLIWILSVVWLLAAFAAVSMFCGCRMFPATTERSATASLADQQSSAQNMTIRRVTQGQPAPAQQPMPHLTISGASNSVDITVNPASTIATNTFSETLDLVAGVGHTSSSEQAKSSASSVSIPLGVSLSLLAIGIAALVFSIRYAIAAARKSSAAIDATVGYVDHELASRIRNRKKDVGSTTEPTEQAWMNAEIADDESLRGRLASLLKRS